MLAYSPPLPLIIDHLDESHDITTRDEEDILLALQHHDRVRRIRLQIPIPNLRKIFIAMDEEFPMPEFLYVEALGDDDYTSLILPTTFQAPHLRHLSLNSVVYPVGSPLITTATGLVTLMLGPIPLSTYISPNQLLRWLSLLPQREIFAITFLSPIPSRDVESHLLHMPIMTHVTLPYLRWVCSTVSVPT